ncbi:DUF4979 domain-containing protein [Sphingobacterium alkalisoli]|uniref:DUF4979 domain-containing protein n=1 Tax=Sphingobacterium alkalisoli TaxID=1874115 RepID=A0A4U0H9U3_9SPHI|nr:DUF4979 domain-containing protein [Sphingobacterium alkalisoli]TJY68164.1 DUF4979 domain-containing protein [Sphingobacterium alkalisoli]GGH08580.1 hypothetical protein GCM10011418_06110 [Sphingobacterium alkalisoli]
MKSLDHSRLTIFMVLFVGIILGACEKGPNFREFVYPAPIVDDFYPKQGYIGSTITIEGADFGTTIKAVKIFFGGIQAADPIVVENNKIEVLVPENAVSGKVTVDIYGKQDEAAADFVLMPSARIIGASTDKANEGDEVTITGENFGTDISLIQVFIGAEEYEAEIIAVEETAIRFLTPNVPSGSIIAVVDGQHLVGPYLMVGIEKIGGTLIGHTGSWGNNAATTIQAAVDGDITTFVDGPTAIGYVGYDLGEGKATSLKSVRYVPRTTHASRMNGGEIRGSNDPSLSTYTVLHTINGTPATGVYTEVNIETEEEYRYIYYYTANGNGNIAEIEFYGNVVEKIAPVGSLIWVFNMDGQNWGWEPQQSPTAWSVGGGALQVTFSQTSGNKRSDLMQKTLPVKVHTGNYPIIAMKMDKPEGARITFDTNNGSFGNGFNKYSTDYADQRVYYWDMSTLSLGSGAVRTNEEISFTTFQFKIADIPAADPATGYKIYWIRTFQSKEKLAEFLGL